MAYYDSNGSRTLYVQPYDALGNALDSPITVAASGADLDGAAMVATSYDNSGKLRVAWETADVVSGSPGTFSLNVHLQRFSGP